MNASLFENLTVSAVSAATSRIREGTVALTFSSITLVEFVGDEIVGGAREILGVGGLKADFNAGFGFCFMPSFGEFGTESLRV